MLCGVTAREERTQGQATDHAFLRGYYQQEMPWGGGGQPGSLVAWQSHPTQPYLPRKNKVHPSGMCARASASPRLAGRRRILLWGLIKKPGPITGISQPWGWEGCNQVPVTVAHHGSGGQAPTIVSS